MTHMFGGPSIPAPPDPTPAPQMPSINSAAALEARRRKIAQVQQRSGRASTILSGENDYSGGQLGTA